MATAISPVIDGSGQDEITYPGPPPKYEPLPSLCADRYVIVMKWKLNDAEVQRVLATGEIYVQLWTGDEPLHPILVSVSPPALAAID